MKLKPSKALETKGVFSRDTLTKVFTDYIYAYLYTTNKQLAIAPTLMFIMHQINGDGHPIAIPFTILDYQVSSLEGFVALLIEQYPPNEFLLDMIMYSRFDPDYTSKEVYRIMFGARDVWGASVYTVYKFEHTQDGDKMTPYEMNSDNFDHWMQDSPQEKKFRDAYLQTAVSMYHSMISLKYHKVLD